MDHPTEFGSVCSGIEAATVAWHGLGWRAAWLAEVDKFASAVLAHHYPAVPNLGDMTTISRRVLTGEVPAPDVLCGGTPCQAFSVAGLRNSLADQRGNLTLKFVELADAIDHVRARAGKPAAVVFWENVPGVLSTKDNAFGCFLAGLAGEDGPLQPPGQRWANAGAVYGPQRAVAWRTLDAQYFGLAQRRRRVFVVASSRPGFDPAQVLFEWDGLRRDTAPSRQAREVAATIPSRSLGGGGLGTDFDCDGGLIAGTLQANGKAAGSATQQDAESGLLVPTLAKCLLTGSGLRYDTDTILPVVTHSLRAEGFDASEDGTGRGTPLVPCTVGTLTANGDAHSGFKDERGLVPVAYTPEVAATMVARSSRGGGQTNSPGHQADSELVASAMQVRRLTPTECERLQGFPDGYTAIPWRGKPADQCPDGPRYKALGNSWPVPVVAWIGRRIDHAMKAAA